MSLEIYCTAQSEQWDEIVCSFKKYDVYYLSGYVKAFQINGDGEALLLYYNSEEMQAVNVVIKRDVAEDPHFKKFMKENVYYDLATPYGYGGWLIENKSEKDDAVLKEKLSAAYLNWCRENHIVSEFVRFHPFLKNWEGLEEIYHEERLGGTVWMDTRNRESIWQNMTSQSRNMIRKAQKNGLKTYWGRDPWIIEPFMEIYRETMDRDQAEKYYYFKRAFYESILEDLKQNAMWFYVKKEGEKEIAAAAVFLFCNGSMHYHLSASRKEYQKMAPGNLLLYEAAVWASAHGYQKLHLGGGVGSGKDGLYKFKKAFYRGEDLDFYIGKKIFDRENYEKLVHMREESDPAYTRGTGYFPEYRG